VNHASIGIYPHAVNKRETYQRTLGVGRFSAMGYALLETFFRKPVMRLDLNHEHGRQHLKAPFVFVGNNRFEAAPFSFIRRQTLDQGHLHILYVPQLPALVFLKIALGIVFKGLRNAPELHEQWRQSFTITGRSKPFKVSLDGEVLREAPPLKFRSRSQVLRVIVPSLES
jgi:diacylglycerol kinase family enzyme